MYKEQEIIKKILSILPKSKLHINKFYESDAEVFDFGDKRMLFTVDEFSNEDLFRDHNPFKLGRNLAIGTISDILASGGEPKFYAHSMVIDEKKWDDIYIESFSKGIADVLEKSGAVFIGGDLGKSKSWRYTGICLGEAEKPISRKGCKEGDIILMTGKVGAGNLEAALKLYSDNNIIGQLIKNYDLELRLRLDESRVINNFATSCIDSSDGILNALNTLAEINEVGYSVGNLPYSKQGVLACKLLLKPKYLLFMGEAGEYELLFTLKEDDEKEFMFISKEKDFTIYKIGQVTDHNVKVLNTNGGQIDLLNFNIRARDYGNPKDYIDALINFLKK